MNIKRIKKLHDKVISVDMWNKVSHPTYFILEGFRKECDAMQIGDFILNGLGGQGNNNNNQAGILGANCCPTNNQVAGANAVNLAGLGVNCCPTDNQVLGIGTGRTIEVPEVLGIGEGNTLVEVCIPVIPPGFTILFDSIERNLVFDALVAANGKVFVNGRLIKKIPFETCDQSVTPTTGNITRIVLSNVRAITIETPFALCINLPQAVRGTRVVVLQTHIDSVELPNLLCPNQPCIRSITEKDCINVRVKVERDTMIRVPTAI